MLQGLWGRRIPGELVERIWERDSTVWPGKDEAQWLGWLDEPLRMRQRLGELGELAEAADGVDDVVLLGMGGSSLAPEVLRRAFGRERFHVLDTTHPRAIRRLADSLDLGRTLFVVSSKSGGTLETRSHFDFFWEQGGRHCVAITDPGSPLEQLARTRNVRVFAGEPTIGGRYSALSRSGPCPPRYGVELGRCSTAQRETPSACHARTNPGLALGLALGASWQEGRDKVIIRPNPRGFGLWVEQLLAESTGKEGRGLVPAPDESPDGPDRQVREVELDDPYDLGSEFFRWEFATSVAGAILEINPFDQPNVQGGEWTEPPRYLPAGAGGCPGAGAGRDGGGVASRRGRATTWRSRRSSTRPRKSAPPFVERVRAATDCVVTFGLGPRYCTRPQLHKGGALIGCFLQVVDDTGDELAIPGQKFGFGRLIRAQAAGDYAALKERGRPGARVRLEEIT